MAPLAETLNKTLSETPLMALPTHPLPRARKDVMIVTASCILSCHSYFSVSNSTLIEGKLHLLLLDNLVDLYDSGWLGVFYIRQISPEYPNTPLNIFHRPQPEYPGKGTAGIVNLNAKFIIDHLSCSDYTQTSHLGWFTPTIVLY